MTSAHTLSDEHPLCYRFLPSAGVRHGLANETFVDEPDIDARQLADVFGRDTEEHSRVLISVNGPLSLNS